jgi:PAS domain S-box-containing protein
MRGTSDSLLGHSIFECHPSKDHERVSQILDDLKVGRETTRYHRVKRSGIVEAQKESHYDIFYTAVKNSAGRYLGTAMIIRDTREIKMLQEQVQRSEERYRDLVENIDSGIFSLDTTGRVVYASNGLLKMVGYSLSEMISRLWIELLKPERRVEAGRVFHTVLSQHKASIFETEMVRRDGSPIFALVNLSAFGGDAETATVIRGIVTDITARKELEKETLKRERFEGVIEMAGAACHHLNQPLANILVRVQLLLKEMDEQDSRYRSVHILENEVLRMGNITRKIQNITKYETEPYVEGRSRIVDLERATGKK